MICRLPCIDRDNFLHRLVRRLFICGGVAIIAVVIAMRISFVDLGWDARS